MFKKFSNFFENFNPTKLLAPPPQPPSLDKLLDILVGVPFANSRFRIKILKI